MVFVGRVSPIRMQGAFSVVFVNTCLVGTSVGLRPRVLQDRQGAPIVMQQAVARQISVCYNYVAEE